MSVPADARKLATDALVKLYTLDTTALGGDIFRFVSDSDVNAIDGALTFDGNKYYPVPFKAEGFERNGQGASPRPKISISNVTRVMIASVITLNDLVGATFMRQRTFRKHLDDGSDPDPTAVFPLDVYRINRKLNQNPQFIEFELAAPTDQQGAQIPARQCLKRTCTHRYRRWDASSGTFDYTKATCPYSSTTYFNQRDIPTSDPADDVCGKQLSSCKIRFGTQPLPTRAFPGIGGQ